MKSSGITSSTTHFRKQKRRIVKGRGMKREMLFSNLYALLRLLLDRIRGLELRLPGYRYRGDGFDARCYQIT
jgi:hypothetical protein